MKFEYLEYLLAIESCGSINEASRKLYLKPQYLSGVLKKTEKEFGTEIFKRNYDGVVPTESGKFILDRFRKILELYKEAHFDFLYQSNEADRQIAQNVTFYTPDFIGSRYMTEILNITHQYFPNISLQMRIMPDNQIPNDVRNTPGSMGLFCLPENEEMPTMEGLSVIPLRKESMVLYADKGNKHARQIKSIYAEDALKLNLILYTTGNLEDSLPYRILSSYGKPNVQFAVNSVPVMMSLLQQGDYYCACSRVIEKDYDVIGIPFIEDEGVDFTSYFIHRTADDDSFVISSFTKIVQAAYQPISTGGSNQE